MKSTFVLAQMASGPEPEENLQKALAMAKKAYDTVRPQVLVFPEYCMSVARPGELPPAEGLDGPFVTRLRAAAKEYGMWIIFGIHEQTGDESDPRPCNTIVVADDRGRVAAVYRKTHLYDAFRFRESAQTRPGEELFRPIDTPFGRLGLMVCYEVRFPEIARDQKQKGAEILIMPAAWASGKLKSLHYNTLIRARAIENTVFVLACDQCDPGTIGESVAVDPMGVTLAAAGEEETLLTVTVDTDRIGTVSTTLPSYENRRTELYHA